MASHIQRASLSNRIHLVIQYDCSRHANIKSKLKWYLAWYSSSYRTINEWLGTKVIVLSALFKKNGTLFEF